MNNRHSSIPPVPMDEADRLAELESYQVLDTPPDEAFDRITRLASQIFNTPIALVSLIDENRQWFKSRVGLDAEETPREVAFCAHAIAEEKTLLVPDATDDERFSQNPLVTGGPNIRFYAGAPLVAPGGHKLGTLCVIDIKPRDIPDKQLAILEDMAAMVVDELMLRRAASTDAMTGVLNRGMWSELAEREYRRAQRYGVALSVMMIDIDRFKSINDRFGHAAGDEVIRAVASACTALVREQDLFGRYGGEEFILLMPHTDLSGAEQLAERIRARVADIEASIAGQIIQCTASVGVTICDVSKEMLTEATNRADQALYDAKAQGRNKVVVRPYLTANAGTRQNADDTQSAVETV